MVPQKMLWKFKKGSNFDARPTATLGTVTLGLALLSRDLSTQGTVNKRIIIIVKLHQHQHHDCIQAARFSQQSFFHIGQVLRKHLFRDIFEKNRQEIFLNICTFFMLFSPAWKSRPSINCSYKLGTALAGERCSSSNISATVFIVIPNFSTIIVFFHFRTKDISKKFNPAIFPKYQL